MNASITITSDHPAFGSVVALLTGGNVAAVASVPPMPSAPGVDDDGDDDTGPVNASAPAVDSTGLPWDERIHAGTKGTNADGSWKAKRGAPKGPALAAIEAELRARAGATVPTPPAAPLPPPMALPATPMQPMQAPPLPPPFVPPVAPVPVATAPLPPVAAPAYSPPPMPTPEPVAPVAPVAAPTPAPAADALDFTGFMQHLGVLMTKRDAAGAPIVHADYLASITKQISDAFAPQGVAPLDAITGIQNSPPMITYAVQLMQRDGTWQA